MTGNLKFRSSVTFLGSYKFDYTSFFFNPMCQFIEQMTKLNFPAKGYVEKGFSNSPSAFCSSFCFSSNSLIACSTPVCKCSATRFNSASDFSCNSASIAIASSLNTEIIQVLYCVYTCLWQCEWNITKTKSNSTTSAVLITELCIPFKWSTEFLKTSDKSPQFSLRKTLEAALLWSTSSFRSVFIRTIITITRLVIVILVFLFLTFLIVIVRIINVQLKP